MFNEEAVKKLSKSGIMIGKEAGNNLDERDADLINDLDKTPMFVNEDLREKVRSNDNRKKALKKHSKRSKAAQRVDNNKKADKVFRDPLKDDELEEWSENPDEFDIKGVDFF